MSADLIAGAMGAALGATLIAATGVTAIKVMGDSVDQSYSRKHRKHERDVTRNMIWG